MVVGFALACAFGVVACVTNGGGVTGGDGEVVERSKEQVPPWCSLDTGKIHEDAATMRFVEQQAGLLDLPLGIKQTQLAALASSRIALATALKERLADVADDAGVALPVASSELDRQVMAATEEFHGRNAKVADIYFEKRRSEHAVTAANPDGESFGVSILIQMPRSGMDELIQSVARQLARSSDASLRRLGQSLTRKAAAAPASGGEMSH